MSKQIAIIGAGTMGTLLQRLFTNAATVTMITRTTFTQTDWQVFDVICFAIKPQDFKMLSALPLEGKLILSVMAGINTDTLMRTTGSNLILRCMPNTPLRTNQGMTVWCKTPAVSTDAAVWMTNQLQAATQLLEVPTDDWIDKATAVSASGPGFLFSMLEQYAAAAQQLGFTADQAQLLVTQTFHGASALMRSSNVPISTLKQQVTSKGGTTAAGLAVLEKQNLWIDVLQAAYQRAKELSQ